MIHVAVPLLVVAAVLPQPESAPASEPSPSVRLLVPAYFYPAGEGLREWKRLLEAASQAPVVAIVNPDSGPGKRADPNYVSLFRLARSSRIMLIGYVTLSYGQRPLSAVKADIDSWLYFYPDVNGIFFDEQPSQPEQAAFALESFAYARAKIDQAVLVTNPGTVCAREYLAARDSPVACLFEHEKGFGEYRLPEWAMEFSPDRFAVLLYGVTTGRDMESALREAVRKRAGYLYITDAKGPMPWGRLPGYWDEEVTAVRRIGLRAGILQTNDPH